MFVVALALGLVFGVLCGALLSGVARLKLAYSSAAVLLAVIVLFALPIPLEVTVGLSSGLLLGFLLTLIKQPASGSKPPIEQ